MKIIMIIRLQTNIPVYLVLEITRLPSMHQRIYIQYTYIVGKYKMSFRNR